MGVPRRRRLKQLLAVAAVVSSWSLAMAFAFSFFVGVSFGLYPALKAGRLNPIEALRTE